MNANPHILDAEQLRKLSRKRNAAAVRKWANRQGIKTLEGADGPWTTEEAVKWASRTRAPACELSQFAHPTHEILARSVACGEPLPIDGIHDPSGVYFLIEGDEVVYVGMSRRVGERIRQHYCAGRRFSRMAFIEVPDEALRKIEAHYIHALNPPWNIQRPPRPVRLMEVIAQ